MREPLIMRLIVQQVQDCWGDNPPPPRTAIGNPPGGGVHRMKQAFRAPYDRRPSLAHLGAARVLLELARAAAPARAASAGPLSAPR